MMQQMAKGGPTGGMPSMDSLMGGGGAGLPGMAGAIPGMEGMDMEGLAKMAQAMGITPPGMRR